MPVLLYQLSLCTFITKNHPKCDTQLQSAAWHNKLIKHHENALNQAIFHKQFKKAEQHLTLLNMMSSQTTAYNKPNILEVWSEHNINRIKIVPTF